MPAPDASALRVLRDAAADRLAQRAADVTAPLTELRDLQERLRLLDAALAEVAPPRRRWRSALWPVLLVAALVSVAATVPVRTVPFTLELQARAVTLQLDAAGELGSQSVDGELRIEGHTRLESAAAALTTAADAGADQLVLRAPQLTLRRLSYPAGSTLIVAGGPQVQLTLDSPRPRLVAEIEFAGLTRWRIGDAPELRTADFTHAEWLRAVGDDVAKPNRRPPPLDLWLARPAGRSYTWSELQPSALHFVERRGDLIAASSLEQARITLPATGDEVRLGNGDRLEIAGLELERFELVAGESVGLRLAGSARVLSTRTGEFERSLKPSLLEFVARHHTIGLFWSGALMLWGVLAWLRRQFDDHLA